MAEKKPLKHKAGKCGGSYLVLQNEDSQPYLECDICGHKMTDWIDWAEKYKDFWKDDAKQNSKRDIPVCALGYFNQKYKEQFDFEYAMSLNDRGLFLGPEITIIRKVMREFPSYSEIKGYLDWFFEAVVKKRKKRITSITIIAYPATMNDYKFYRQKSKTLWRDKPLPPRMTEYLRVKCPEIHAMKMMDYGDLKMLVNAMRAGSISGDEYTKFSDKLIEAGTIDADLNMKNWSE